jgi:hypothetical protein
MRVSRILTPLTLSTAWQIVPITVPAKALALQCRTAVDVLFCNHTDDVKYWTLKSGSSLTLDLEGTKYASAVEATNLISNGTFTGSQAFWTVDETAWTWNVVTDKIEKDADGTGVISQPLSSFTPDRIYQVNLTMSTYTVTGLTVRVGGGDVSATMASDAAHIQYVIAGRTATGLLELVPANLGRFIVDAVSVYALAGPALLAKVGVGTPTLEIMALI